MDSAAAVDAKADLRAKLVAVRNYTVAIYAHLTPAQLQVPQLRTVNPPLWELAHIAWFQEFWCRRTRAGGAMLPSRYPHFDDWYNSSVIPHAARWQLPHPPREAILRQMAETLDDTLLALEQADEAAHYFFELAALHEAMHAEALRMTLQTLGLPAPPQASFGANDRASRSSAEIAARDVDFAGGTFLMGTLPGTSRFVFDNEKWAHPVQVRPFAIANRCVSNEDFARFVDESGYARRELWSESGWTWRSAANARGAVRRNRTAPSGVTARGVGRPSRQLNVSAASVRSWASRAGQVVLVGMAGAWAQAVEARIATRARRVMRRQYAGFLPTRPSCRTMRHADEGT